MFPQFMICQLSISNSLQASATTDYFLRMLYDNKPEWSWCKSLHLQSWLPSTETGGLWCGTGCVGANPGGGAAWADGIGGLLCGRDD